METIFFYVRSATDTEISKYPERVLNHAKTQVFQNDNFVHIFLESTPSSFI